MSSPHKKAYNYEIRIIEKKLGGKRIIDQSKGGCDGVTSWLAVEIFQRDVPKYIQDALDQAEVCRDRGERPLLPIAIMREKHKRDRDAVVMMRLGDFMEWFVE